MSLVERTWLARSAGCLLNCLLSAGLLLSARGAQAPMGRAIIGGVITSTILTLVVVPVLYSYLVRDRKPKRSVRAAEGAGGAIPAAMPADRD